MSEDRRGTTTIAITGRSLPQKSETDRLAPAKKRRSGSNDHKRIGDLDMRHHTHVAVSVPADTPRQGWF